MKVLILNGPPGCGKDTIAKMLCKEADAIQGEFKHQLYVQTAMLLSEIADDFDLEVDHYGLSPKEIRERNEDRELKELPWIGGLSVRRWLQITSEMVVKKDKGSDFFGRAAADDWISQYRNVVVSDGGFKEEIEAVVSAFGVYNVHVIRLHRFGYKFGSDTRTYIKNVPGTVEHDLHLYDNEPHLAVRFLKDILEGE